LFHVAENILTQRCAGFINITSPKKLEVFGVFALSSEYFSPQAYLPDLSALLFGGGATRGSILPAPSNVTLDYSRPRCRLDLFAGILHTGFALSQAGLF
jgi:hypothetical protein